MIRHMFCAALLALTLATGANAQTLDFTTDPSGCRLAPDERAEQDTSFDGKDFWGLEYHCEIMPPLDTPDWSQFRTVVRLGYCEEPGFLEPQAIAFRWFPEEDGLLYVYFDGADQPEIYHHCGG